MSNNRRYVLGAELRAAASDDDSLTITARAVKYNALSLPGVPGAGARERIAPVASATASQRVTRWLPA
jgi:hypothetical protein